jgi:hypothetical protein
VRFLIFHLYQGELWAFGLLALLLAAMVFTKKRFEANEAALR